MTRRRHAAGAITDPSAVVLAALRSLLAGEHPSAGLGELARAAASVTGAAHAVVLFRPHVRGDLVLAGTHGLEDESRRRAVLPLVREIGSWAERTRRGLLVADRADPRFGALSAAGVAGARGVPLLHGDRVLGALTVVWPPTASPPFPEVDPLHAALAALGLRHWAWEEETRTAGAERDEAVRLQLRADRAAAMFEHAAGMAREIRGAARAAVRVTERLGAVDDPDLRAARELLTEQLGRIDRVASQLLEAGDETAPVIEPSDLGDLVEAALDRVESQLRARRVRVSRRIGVSVPLLVLDADLVRRALANLLVAVGERVPAKGRLKVEMIRRGDVAEVWVAADGPPEPGGVLDILWAPFLGPEAGGGFSVGAAAELLRSTGARIETRVEPDWPQSFRLCLPLAGNTDRRGGDDRRRRRERRRA